MMGVGVGTGRATYGLRGVVRGVYEGVVRDVGGILWEVSRGRRGWG